MKQNEIRTLVRDSHRKPLRVCMADGKTYTISHPDFAAVAEDAVIIVSGPDRELGQVGFVICYFDQITRLEQLKPKAKAA